MAEQIKFGSTIIAAPTVFKPTFQDLDSDKSTRNSNGVMNRDRIRGSMRTLHFEWGDLTLSEISAILQAISGVSTEVYYPDPMDGQWETRTMYVGNRSTEAVCDLNKDIWKGLSFDLVED